MVRRSILDAALLYQITKSGQWVALGDLDLRQVLSTSRRHAALGLRQAVALSGHGRSRT
jgi:hypothetical protein